MFRNLGESEHILAITELLLREKRIIEIPIETLKVLANIFTGFLINIDNQFSDFDTEEVKEQHIQTLLQYDFYNHLSVGLSQENMELNSIKINGQTIEQRNIVTILLPIFSLNEMYDFFETYFSGTHEKALRLWKEQLFFLKNIYPSSNQMTIVVRFPEKQSVPLKLYLANPDAPSITLEQLKVIIAAFSRTLFHDEFLSNFREAIYLPALKVEDKTDIQNYLKSSDFLDQFIQNLQESLVMRNLPPISLDSSWLFYILSLKASLTFYKEYLSYEFSTLKLWKALLPFLEDMYSLRPEICICFSEKLEDKMLLKSFYEALEINKKERRNKQLSIFTLQSFEEKKMADSTLRNHFNGELTITLDELKSILIVFVNYLKNTYVFEVNPYLNNSYIRTLNDIFIDENSWFYNKLEEGINEIRAQHHLFQNISTYQILQICSLDGVTEFYRKSFPQSSSHISYILSLWKIVLLPRLQSEYQRQDIQPEIFLMFEGGEERTLLSSCFEPLGREQREQIISRSVRFFQSHPISPELTGDPIEEKSVERIIQ